MPFSYFPDADEARWKKKGIYDIDDWLKKCTKTFCGEEFLLPQQSGSDAKYLEGAVSTPYPPPYYSSSLMEGGFRGHPAFIFCPGPSFKEVDLGAFAGCLTIAVNSAGFEFNSYLWTMAECVYMNWFVHRHFDPCSVFLWNPRTAFRYMAKGRLRGLRKFDRQEEWSEATLKRQNPFKAAFVHKWEEEKTIPPRNPAPSTTAALVAAWKLGCDRAYIIGMDLSKPGGETYIDSVPHTERGAQATFEYQLKALRQFNIPGFQVYNGSPYSQHEDLPFEKIHYSEIEDIAIKCSAVPPIESFTNA